jgi:hypothetical protein
MPCDAAASVGGVYTRRVGSEQGVLLELRDHEWIPLGPGTSFKPVAFLPDDHRQLILRVEPGVVVARHRHRGSVHAFNLSGSRMILGPDVIVGPHTYVHEPVGNVDSWMGVGTEPCIVHIAVSGAMEYLDDDDNVISSDNTASLQATYLRWCAETGHTPDPALAGPV